MVELIDHLNSIYPLSDEVISALIKVARVKELRRGQVWLQEGAVCDKLVFVVKGILKLYFETGSKELILDFAKEKEFLVSAQSYFTGTPSIYSIRTVEPCVVVSIAKNDLDYIINRFIELQIHVSSIAHLQISSLEKHTALLMLPPKDRFEKLLASDSWLIDGRRITDKLLAGYLGVRASTICEWRRSVR